MTRIIYTPKALLVEVPDGATDFHLARSHNELWFKVNGRVVKDTKLPEYPPGSYGQPILASEMVKESQWEEVVDGHVWVHYNGHTYEMQYRNYMKPQEIVSSDFSLNSAVVSGHSLLSSHNLQPSNTVVIPKII